MIISKVYDNDDNRENNFDQKNSLSFKLRQARNQIKLNQKIVIRNVVTKRVRDRIFIVLKKVCPKTRSYHAFLVFNRIYINCI